MRRETQTCAKKLIPLLADYYFRAFQVKEGELAFSHVDKYKDLLDKANPESGRIHTTPSIYLCLIGDLCHLLFGIRSCSINAPS